MEPILCDSQTYYLCLLNKNYYLLEHDSVYLDYLLSFNRYMIGSVHSLLIYHMMFEDNKRMRAETIIPLEHLFRDTSVDDILKVSLLKRMEICYGYLLNKVGTNEHNHHSNGQHGRQKKNNRVEKKRSRFHFSQEELDRITLYNACGNCLNRFRYFNTDLKNSNPFEEPLALLCTYSDNFELQYSPTSKVIMKPKFDGILFVITYKKNGKTDDFEYLNLSKNILYNFARKNMFTKHKMSILSISDKGLTLFAEIDWWIYFHSECLRCTFDGADALEIEPFTARIKLLHMNEKGKKETE